MKKHFYFLIVLLIFHAFSSNAQLPKLKKSLDKNGISLPGTRGLSQDEVARGLKEALNKGIEKGVDKLSVKDGYFKDDQIKLLLPKEAQQVEAKLRKLGQGEKVDATIESLNRAAEDAAGSAKELFVSAIKNLTLKDAMNILKGNNDAATIYLSNSTRPQLIEKFTPIIKVSLEKVGATAQWAKLFNAYNKIPFVEKVNPDLVAYATDKAIEGLFIQVAKQELEIRKNPAARTTALLKKVFG
tara:strand:- start:567 stop:1292 length:726 start_codon:yes stop_codon:yes gene_type:complete